jgi:hypothetical protein
MFLEEFQIWKRFGAVDVRSMQARTVEALMLLEDQWQREVDRQRRSERD